MRAVAAMPRDHQLLFSALLLGGLGDYLWLTLQPLYIKSLGAEPGEIGAALATASLVVLGVYIPTGWLADRGHYKPLIIAAWLTGTAAVFWLALAPDWRWAIPGFALFYLSSFARPALTGYLAATAPGQDVGRLMGWVFSGYWIGTLAAPAAGGWLAAALGLRAIFWIAGALYLVSIGVLVFLGRPPRRVYAASFQLGPLLRNRAFLWQMLVFGVTFFAVDVGLVLAPNYLQEVKALSLGQIGGLGTLLALGAVALGLLLPRLGAAGSRRPLLGTLIGLMAAVGLLWAAPAGGPAFLTLGMTGLAYFLRGGAGAIWALTSSWLAHTLPEDLHSLSFGVRDTVNRLALILSPWAAGQLYAGRPEWALFGGLAALAAALLLTLTLPRK